VHKINIYWAVMSLPTYITWIELTSIIVFKVCLSFKFITLNWTPVQE